VRRADRRALPLLRAAAQKYHDRLAVLAEIDPVTRAKIDLRLEDTASDPFDGREVALPEAVQRGADLRCGVRIQIVEPAPPRRPAA